MAFINNFTRSLDCGSLCDRSVPGLVALRILTLNANLPGGSALDFHSPDFLRVLERRRDMAWERLSSGLEFEESSEGVMNTTGSIYT